MSWRNLFNVRTVAPRKKGTARAMPAEAAPEESKGVFVTPQSLTTFPVATTIIGVVWKVMENLNPAWKGSLWVPAVITLVLGAILLFISLDPNVKRTTRDYVIAVAVGVINTFYLFASAAGLLRA